MAEFREVMEQFNRMCMYHHRNLTCRMGCPMDGVNISQCRKIITECPEIAEKTIIAWAKEHPEPPVYPTWRDYVMSLLSIDDKGNDRIPEDIAKILKIDPINSQSEHTL